MYTTNIYSNMQAQGSMITQNNVTEAIHPEKKMYYVSLYTGFGSYLSPNLYSDYYFKIGHKCYHTGHNMLSKLHCSQELI